MWCPVLGGLLVMIIFPGHARKTIIPHYDCDHDRHKFMKEGNQGPVGMFPWLGVIRVTLSEGTKLRIAVTGAVLIRTTFAITEAEDIAKIPKKILREHSKAMFMSSDDLPWLYSIRGFEPAPDFKMSTMSSIALVELQLKDDPTPLMPICWQDRNHRLSHTHYAVGFTDERYILEKLAYKMQFINKSNCETYYENLDIHAKNYVPVNYQCWAAMNNTRNCMWENGMILVANYTGTWFLLGIGIRGPGCGLPVRFISVLPYVEWIESVINGALIRMNSERIRPRVKEVPVHTFYANEHQKEVIVNNDEIQEFLGMQFRKAFNPLRKPFKPPPNQDDDRTRLDYDGVASDYDEAGQESGRRAPGYRRIYVPHNASITDPPVLDPDELHGKTYRDKHWERVDIRHMDPNVLQFTKFGDKYERRPGDCTKVGHMVYKEIIEVTKTPNVIGYAYYKLSLLDLAMYRYTCVVIRIKSRSRSDCNLWYSFAKSMDEPLGVLDDTPGKVIKHYIPVAERSTSSPFLVEEAYWEPHQNLEAYFIKEGDHPLLAHWWKGRVMVNLFLKFDFVDDAEMVLELWGPSSEGMHGILTMTDTPAMMNRTVTRRKGRGNITRSTRRRTRRSTQRTKRTRGQRRNLPKLPIRMKKETITKTGNLTVKLVSNSSDYMDSGSSLSLIVILFITTFG